MLRVGLTGGIASGKSTVAELFARRGVPVIDADRIAHRLSEPGQPGYRAILALLGPAVLDAAGRIDRRRVRDRVFRDAALRRRLEAALHPLIRTEMQREAARHAAAPYALLVIPLLVEAGQRDLVDRVLVVDADDALRLAWLCERDAMEPDAARRIMAAQADRPARRAAADDWLENTGDPQALEAAVDALHRKYLALAGAPRGD